MSLLPCLPWKAIIILLLNSQTNCNYNIIAFYSCDIFTEAVSMFPMSAVSKWCNFPRAPCTSRQVDVQVFSSFTSF